MNCIVSVDELVATLKKSKPKDYVNIARFMDIKEAELTKYAYWNTKGYTRNCIERTDEFELLLLCWNPGDTTPIHGHGEQRCWVYQVSGSMEEVVYKENAQNEITPDRSRQLKPGDLCYMEDSMGYHTIHNNSGVRAMSLHLYAKPIDSCTCYNEDVADFIPKDMSYHSYKGTLIHNPNKETQVENHPNITKTLS